MNMWCTQICEPLSFSLIIKEEEEKNYMGRRKVLSSSGGGADAVGDPLLCTIKGIAVACFDLSFKYFFSLSLSFVIQKFLNWSISVTTRVIVRVIRTNFC